jgi:hypothetical protein
MTGVIGALLPSDFFSRVVPSSVASMVLMVMIGAPLYVCASASTPLAAAFVAKGASVGAALVFLLVGPATNAATLATVRRTLGANLVSSYLTAIVGVAMAVGLLTDLLLPDRANGVSLGDPTGPDPLATVKLVGMLVFSVLLLRSLWRTGIRTGVREIAENARMSIAWARQLHPRALLASTPVRAVVALWLVAIATASSAPPGSQALVRR